MGRSRVFALVVVCLIAPCAFAQLGIGNRYTFDVTLVADVNGDGLDDILTNNSVALNLGNGAFGSPAAILPANQRPYATLDFNGDGKIDLITVDVPSWAPVGLGGPPPGPSAYHLYVNDGHGNFTLVPKPLPNGFPTVVDFNRDGKSDLMMESFTPATPNGALLFYASNGDGTFTLTDSHENFDALEYLTGGTTPQVTTADFNGDGNPDIVVSTVDYIVFLMGNGSGKFEEVRRFFPQSTGLRSMMAADVDGDGRADLVFTTYGAINVMFGGGSGTFPTTASIAISDVQGREITFAIGRFTAAKQQIACGLDNGDLLVLSYEAHALKIAARVPTDLQRLVLLRGAFGAAGKSDLLGTGYGSIVNDRFSDYHVRPFFSTAPASVDAIPAPHPSRRRTVAYERQDFTVSINGNCTSYSDHWTFVQEGFFLNEIIPSAGRRVEACSFEGEFRFRVVPDGSAAGIPLVTNGLIVPLSNNQFAAAANGVDPCGQRSFFFVTVTRF